MLKIFRSVLYGLLWVTGTGIPCFRAYAISAVREFRFQEPPGRDDFNAGLKRIIGKLETHLIVALAGRSVRHGIRAFFGGEIDLRLRN